MFPSTQLISYVFANPGDEYRGGDLLTLNLQQYLWKSLHQQYKTVYFLRSTDSRAFTVHTFPEHDAVRPGSPMFWQSAEEVFGKWLLAQLSRKKDDAVAIVCPLDEFCRVLSHDVWRPILKKIANAPNRTGIFVLTAPPYAEDSRKWLLESPVFELLRERAVTDNRNWDQSVYTAIRREKPDHLRFLNTFTPDRTNDLLLHICARYPERCLSTRDRLALAADLAARLQDGQMLPGQQEPSQPAAYQTYRWLYEQLCSENVWNRLTAPDRVQLPFFESPEAPVLHSPSCCLGKCTTLQLPAWARDRKDSRGKPLKDILQDIQRLVTAPANCPENKELADAAFDFMKQLHELDTDDIDTCALLLDALKFCTKWIHIQREDSKYEEVSRILNGLKVCTEDSAACFRGNRELSALEADPPSSGQELLALMSSKKKLNEKMNTLHNYIALLKSNIFTMETSGYIDSRALMDVFVKEMQNSDTDEFALTNDQWSGYSPYTPSY